VAHEAFAAAADPVLDQAPAPVAHLGIDEHRRGRPRWGLDPDTGEYLLLADRWHTCFFDLSADQGLLGQVEGRTADDGAYWLAQATPAWRDAGRVVVTGMCSIYASAVRRMLPGAQIAVDLFHVGHLAVKMTGDVRRRVVRGKYGRRGRSGDPEYGIKHLLARNLEHLSPAQFAKVTGILGSDPAGQEIAAAWIGKEKLRHALTCWPASPARSRASATSGAGSSPSTTGAPRTTTSPSCSASPGPSPGGRTRSSARS
jgi:transposase